MDKYQNKYRIPSARLQTWDYSSNGLYFITICTANRAHYFGDILLPGTMVLNRPGELAETFWLEIPTQFPFIELGNFVVMPNHIHGILIIDHPVETRFIASPTQPIASPSQPIASPSHPIASPFQSIASPSQPNTSSHQSITSPSQAIAPQQPIPSPQGGITGNRNPMLQENISRVLRWYKGKCSFEIRKIIPEFAWQSRFHDHIIRDARGLESIQNYIINNPQNWKEDKFYN
jgi:REP element-mobilizing transposase RayT